MRRHAALLKWSREHHAALVLAQCIANVADEAAIVALVKLVPAIFRRELEPHFHAEEALLRPLLESAGKKELLRCMMDEHRQLRALVARITCGDQASLQTFGSALRAHVRLEERELFPAVETILLALNEVTPAFHESG